MTQIVVKTACYECLAVVDSFGPRDPFWDGPGIVSLAVYSAHDRMSYRRGLRGAWARLKDAWGVLWNHPQEFVEFNEKGQVEQLVEFLQKAKAEAWPDA